jgi:hypothetical protein
VSSNIRLTTALSSEFENVQDLRNAIASPSMYTHPALFDLQLHYSALGADHDIRLTTALSSEFENVQDLRNAIASPSMYTHPALFDLFCAGLESGRLRSTKKMDMSPIEQIITVAHEAHFRLELWYSLRGLNYSHDTSKKNIEERHNKFGEFCRYVNADRNDNATEAFTTKTAAGPPIVDDAASSSDEDDGPAEDFW